MFPGPNKAAANEVLDFVNHGELFTGTAPPSALDVVVVNQIPEWNFDESPDRKRPAEAKDAAYYKDLQEDWIAMALPRVPPTARQFLREFFLRTDEYLITIGNKLTEEYDESVVDRVLSDLLWCAKYRAVFGVMDQPIEKMFAIYRSGGWSVGWWGEFSAGTFMAIYPGLPLLVKRKPPRIGCEQWMRNQRAQLDLLGVVENGVLRGAPLDDELGNHGDRGTSEE